MRNQLIRLFAVAGLLASLDAHATSIEMLKSFLQQATSGRARFAQIVVDSNFKQLQQATGVMEFARPGKFRWEYDKPYEQTIVGDGSRLWIYDKDLNQVVVQRLDQALGTSPAALLAGSNEIEKSYNLTNLGNQEGLDWVEAVPKTKENTFERVRLGFGTQGLEAMELHDQFGHTTVIKFTALEHNPVFPPGTFRFVPPKGADVISE